MIHIAGENVVDLLPIAHNDLRPILGGGPANTAIAAARLGASVAFAARIGADTFGRAFRRRLTAAGVDLTHAIDLPRSSALALAALDSSGAATYEFWLDGAADFIGGPLPKVAPGDIQHIGSLAAYWPPGADSVEEWITGSDAVVTFDVNLRPVVLQRQSDSLARLERLARKADVVKASIDDLRLAYPEKEPESVARAWIVGDRARLAILTMGGDGVVGLTRDGGRIHVPATPVEVADTIGAGDAAMGALLAMLSTRDIDAVMGALDTTLRFIVAAAALACTKAGAYAPSLAEVEGALRRRGDLALSHTDDAQ